MMKRKKIRSMKYVPIITLFLLISCTSNEKKIVQEKHLYEETESLSETLTINSDAIENLQALLKKEKFGPEEKSEQLPLGYVGFMPEGSRPIANKLLNESINRLIAIIRKEEKITRRMILDEFENGLNSFNDLAFDTEDRERVCWYYEDIMDIIGLESTDELLNNWMYG